MKKLLAILLVMALCLAYLPVMAEEDPYAVGGTTLEEAVQMMPGYKIDVSDDGYQMICMTDLAAEYYIDNSENGIAVLPWLNVIMGVHLHTAVFKWPDEFSKMCKMVITTDESIHTFVPDEPWTLNEKGERGTGIMCDERMEAVIFDMGKSENVTVEFFQDNATSKSYELTMEQKYLLRQFEYTCETFMPKPAANGTSSLIMSLLSSMFNYTVTTAPNPNKPAEEPAGVINQNTSTGSGTSLDNVADELAKLDQLLADGIISEEEYQQMRKNILGL